MRIDIHMMRMLALRASTRGNAMLLSLPVTYKLAWGKPYRPMVGCTIAECLTGDMSCRR